MYYDWFQEHKKKLVVGIVMSLAFLIGWSGWLYVSRADKVAVTISTVPYDAQVTVNGQPSPSGTVWLTPGTYKIASKKAGFSSREKTVIATDTKKHNVVALALTPKSDSALEWYDRHQDDYKNNEVYGAIEAQANGQYFRDQNPIVSSLPINDPYYQINYTQNQDDSLTLTITTPSPRYRYFAVQKIRELGYDPTDFKIEFSDFKNPLVGEGTR